MEKLLTTKEVCEIFQVNDKTLRSWIDNKYLPESTYKKFGRTIRFNLKKLEEFINE